MDKETAARFLLGIIESLPAIRVAIGDRWPVFADQLRAHVALFESLESEDALVEAIERLLEIFDQEETAYNIFLLSSAFESAHRGASEPAEELSTTSIAEQGRQLCADPDAFAPLPYLNTRFEGIAPEQPLPVGRRVPLIVSVDAWAAAEGSSRAFAFKFPDAATLVNFIVHVYADPDAWAIEVVEPTLIVAPPGQTQQEARFQIKAMRPGSDKLYLTVERADTGVTVQHVWLPVMAAYGPAEGAERSGRVQRVSLPFDSPDIHRPTVEITIQEGRDPGSFLAAVRADLADGTHVRETYVVPIGAAELQELTKHLRQKLNQIVYYSELIVDQEALKRAALPLADAGEQIWQRLFGEPRAPDGLRRFARALRDLPHGSTLRVVIKDRQFILPWALLYDKPGPISAQTLDWSGFWGYRYVLDVLPPGIYRDPTIRARPPGLQALLNDEAALRVFTEVQAELFQGELQAGRSDVRWGAAAAWEILSQPSDAALLYCYCHSTRVGAPTGLPGDSVLRFGTPDQSIRLADLERIEDDVPWNSPLVFLNSCKGAAHDTIFYDGFMSFFIERRAARAFIGTEVDAPQLLAHDFAIHFLRAFAQGWSVGKILWQLRRHYLEYHHTILGFNYSLYGLDEVRLDPPIAPIGG
ncbi:MAG: hypothetical protein ACJ8CR_36315 [Roseiflexaceae bacterium]